MYAQHLLERSNSLRALDDHELAQVSGGTSDEYGISEIVVNAQIGNSVNFGSDIIVTGWSGFSFDFASLGGWWGPTVSIPLQLLDSDGDFTPDINDESPFDANNDTYVITANATLSEIQAANQLVQIELAQLAIVGGALSPIFGTLPLAAQSAIGAGAAGAAYLGQPLFDSYLDQAFLAALAQIQNPDGLGYMGYSAF